MSFRESVRFGSIAVGAAVRSVFDRQSGKKFLIEALASGGPGIAPKFAQFLAARIGGDLDGSTYDAKPDGMPLDSIKLILGSSNPNLACKIDQIEREGIVASFGQVHRAILCDGRDVAIKIQRPGAREAIDRELSLLLKAAAWSPVAKHAFEFASWEKWLQERLMAEVDYLEESRRQSIFFNAFSGDPGIVIPRPIEEYSTREVLVQTWEDSLPFSELKIKSVELQQNFLSQLVKFVARSIFELGLIQTDLQPANFGWRQRPGDAESLVQLVLYDFGATMEIPEERRRAIAHLLSDAMLDIHQNYYEHFIALGFRSDLLAPIRQKFSELCRHILAPMVSPHGFCTTDWCLSDLIDRYLGEDKWIFRTAGPPWFMYLMRMLFGLFHVSTTLNEKLYLRDQFERCASPIIADRSTPLSSKSGLHVNLQAERTSVANYLQIEVTENGAQIVSVQMPARATEDLELLVSDETRARIVESGVDLLEIKNHALEGGLQPQTLFQTTIGKRSYHVWLRI